MDTPSSLSHILTPPPSRQSTRGTPEELAKSVLGEVPNQARPPYHPPPLLANGDSEIAGDNCLQVVPGSRGIPTRI